MPPDSANVPFKCSIAPWLSVRSSAEAIDFYKSAFGLSVNGAEFWLSQESAEHAAASPDPIGGGSIRMILTVPDPHAIFAQAIAAGATQIFPVGEEHGWRLGRVADPFGLHWEIGHQLAA